MADPIQLVSAAKAFRELPHQTAALNWLQEQQRPEVLAEFAELFRADPPITTAPSTDWLTTCLPLVKEFEGCRLVAYPDPGTGGDPWTIGYGHTGADVRQGITWTQQQADAALLADLQAAYAAMLKALPMAVNYSARRQAALTSWVFNVGGTAAAESTLRRRLAAGDDPAVVVREELPRWNKGGGGVMPGLVRRRAAEVALFCREPSNGVLLDVPYEFQNDNASGTGFRECFSSSCAMVARYHGKVANDDEYNRIRSRFGDTTDSGAQLRALGSLGLSAQFRQNGGAGTLEQLLRAGQPVPVGWLHKGAVTRPSGGGHWSVVIGFDAGAFIHNDPNGEADLVNGGYIRAASASGRGVRYSRQNWLRRWEADGHGSGWFLDIRA